MRARRTSVLLALLLSSGCGGGSDLPVMRDLGTTSTTSLVRSASAPSTDAATSTPPTASSSTASSSTVSSSTTSAPPTASSSTVSSSTTSAPPVEVATVVRVASGVTLLDTFREAADGEVWWQLPDPGPVDGPRVLLATDLGDPEWVEVLLPVRPNGTRGWVRRSDVTLSTVDTRIVVDLAERRLTAYRGHEVLLDATVVVGAPETPTPTGRFYVNEIQQQADPGTERGAWLLGLAAFSEVLGIIDGGEPTVAIHGTNQPEQLGEAVSLGCIRVEDAVVEQLAGLPLGTPVEIRA